MDMKELERRLVRRDSNWKFPRKKYRELFGNEDFLTMMCKYLKEDFLFSCEGYPMMPLASLLFVTRAPLNAIQFLIQNGLDINAQDVLGRQSFWYMVSYQPQVENVDNLFLSHWTPDPNIKDMFGKNLLQHLVDRNINPLNDEKLLKIMQWCPEASVCVKQIGPWVEAVTVRRPVLRWQNPIDGIFGYAFMLNYMERAVLVPFTVDHSKSNDVLEMIHHDHGFSQKCVMDLKHLLTGNFIYSGKNSVFFKTDNDQQMAGHILIADIPEKVLKKHIIEPFNTLFVPSGQRASSTDLYAIGRLEKGPYKGQHGLMMSLTPTRKKLVLLYGEGFDFDPKFVSIHDNEWSVLKDDNGVVQTFTCNPKRIERSFGYLMELLKCSRLDFDLF